jgi:hypothetical protein
MFVRHGWKGLLWTNTLSYYEQLKATSLESFITSPPGRRWLFEPRGRASGLVLTKRVHLRKPAKRQQQEQQQHRVRG